MTAQELLLLLAERGITLVPDLEGSLQYVAPAGAFTPKLKALVRAYKQGLVQLLTTHTPAIEDQSVVPASAYRRWVTGAVPLSFPLPAPLYHDTPSAPVIYWGERCVKKACQKAGDNQALSLRYFPSGTCCACWQRWDKTVTREEVDEGGG
jgi:hypothetical protein